MDLALTLNDRWPDWEVSRWDGWSLVLIADLDLTYHHAVEVTFTGVQYVVLTDNFSHPSFRDPTPEELSKITAMFGPEIPPAVLAWDADTANGRGTFLIACDRINVTEGHFAHDQKQR